MTLRPRTGAGSVGAPGRRFQVRRRRDTRPSIRGQSDASRSKDQGASSCTAPTGRAAPASPPTVLVAGAALRAPEPSARAFARSLLEWAEPVTATPAVVEYRVPTAATVPLDGDATAARRQVQRSPTVCASCHANLVCLGGLWQGATRNHLWLRARRACGGLPRAIGPLLSRARVSLLRSIFLRTQRAATWSGEVHVRLRYQVENHDLPPRRDVSK